MTDAIFISSREAADFLLRYQGLHQDHQLSDPAEIPEFIRRVGCIQYDPLRPAAPNADLVLQSRFPEYRTEYLDALLYRERLLLDGWDKNMSIWHRDDWPAFSRRRDDFRRQYADRRDEFAPVRREVLDFLERHSSISSRDLGERRRTEWAWAPTSVGRAVLESMYHCGELIVHHKQGSRKSYGPASALLPGDLAAAGDPFADVREYHDWYILRRIRSMGLLWKRGSDAWLGVPCSAAERSEAVERLLAGELIGEARVEGIEDPLYYPVSAAPLLGMAGPNCEARFLAPLDNLLWDRNLIEKLFGFRYRWEVYTPVRERSYGYYVLPVLCGRRFAARAEPVFERTAERLVIRNWWWEPDFRPGDDSVAALRKALLRFADFLGARSIEFDESARAAAAPLKI